tara:strand:- start:297 stop:434 length:138 start_codon:yes stop_codon:yes gene_type:complete
MNKENDMIFAILLAKNLKNNKEIINDKTIYISQMKYINLKTLQLV